MSGMEAVVQEFLAESFEGLDQLDQDLVRLEQNPSDREVFERIFRTVHTIKGTCGFLAFHKLESVAHAGENLLGQLRDGVLALTPETTTELLALIDALRTMLREIEASGGEGEAEYTELIDRLKAIEGGAASAEKKSPEKRTRKRSTRSTASKTPRSRKAAGGAPKQKGTRPHAGSGKAAASADAAEPEPPPAEAEPPPAEAPPAPAVGESSIRVDVTVLDDLMNLVGELVLARNQIVEHMSALEDAGLTAASQRLNSVTSELQEAVMKTRMQPISTIWGKLPRLVRDLALSFGKEVTLTTEGQETELDKAVIEAIRGSLVHLVRNSVDHGIEAPEERETSGKPRTGRLALRADHEGGHVLIEVADDGRGLDRDKIVDRALSAGLVDAERAAYLSEREIDRLVFLPGFSTSEHVTNVSGRGVGLDVVRANTEGIGGTIELSSEPGRSTTFRLKIPLTLTIIPVLIVRASGQRFAIPQGSVVELVRLVGAGDGPGIEELHGVPVYRLRGKLLPLLFLNRELGLSEDEAAAGDGTANIVVLHGDQRHFGLVVDTIDDSQEIVVKPLGALAVGLPYAGATILGDGRVALILDVYRLGLGAGVVSEVRDHLLEQEEQAVREAGRAPTRLLYVGGPQDERMALHLPIVSRLELLPRARVERVGPHEVIQYRDEILQLINLAESLPERRQAPRETEGRLDADALQVVVCTVDGRRVGLVVASILDIVEEDLKVSRPGSRAGVEACVVVGGRVTEVVDVPTVLRMVDPGFFERPPSVEAGEA